MKSSLLTAVLLFSALGITRAEDKPLVVNLWEKGVPGFESRRDEPEVTGSYFVKNINNPSIQVYLPPKDKNTGVGIVVCPGGGFTQLVIKPEGNEPAQYLTNLGIAAFVLKYRLPRETNSPYSLPKAPTEDGQRAMRVVRAHAAEWGVDPKRIGIIGFSAGGEVASLTSYTPGEGNPAAPDPIDRLSARPDFQIMVYPGPVGLPETVPSFAPPSFWLAASDDRSPAKSITDMISKYRDAKINMEAHLLAHGGHGFNMGNRSKLVTVKNWTGRLTDWLTDNVLNPDTSSGGKK